MRNFRYSFCVLVGGLLLLSGGSVRAVPIVMNITQLTPTTLAPQAATMGSLTQVSPVPTTYAINTDFQFFLPGALASTVLGSAQGLLDSVIASPGGGCNLSDYAGFQAGHIALVQAGTCLFSTAVNTATVAGAIGAIVDVSNVAPIGGANNFGHIAQTTIVSVAISNQLSTALQTQLQAVPEPASLALLGIGLAGLGFARKKKAL